MKVQLSAILVHQIWEEQEWRGGKSQLTCIYSPLGSTASHNYWETICEWQMCERLQGSETLWFLSLPKDPLLSHAWGLLTCLVSSSPWCLSAFSCLFAIPLFPFHPLPTRLAVSCLYTNEISFHFTALPKDQARVPWARTLLTFVLLKGELINSLLPLYSV